MKIVFFGTPEFALPTLDTIHKASLGPHVIVTTPDKARGRGQKTTLTPVGKWAKKHHVPLLNFTKLDIRAIRKISAIEPTIGILAAYGQLIPETLIAVFPKGILNIHPSLLPRYRGASPIQTAILKGDRTTGVSVMLLTKGLDEGPILAQKEVTIKKNENAGELTERLALAGASLISATLNPWLRGLITPKPQDNTRATYTRLFQKSDAQLNWQKDAETLARHVRAFSPKPGAYTFINIRGKTQRLKILNAYAIKKENPPDLFVHEKAPAFGTAKGALVCTKLQLEGRGAQSGEDFLHGYSMQDIHSIKR